MESGGAGCKRDWIAHPCLTVDAAKRVRRRANPEAGMTRMELNQESSLAAGATNSSAKSSQAFSSSFLTGPASVPWGSPPVLTNISALEIADFKFSTFS